MKEIILVLALFLSFGIAYIPVVWIGKYTKRKRKQNTKYLSTISKRNK